MTVAMELARCAIILAYNVQVHQLTNAHLVQTLFKPKEYKLPHRVYVQINILMICKISFVNLVHLHVMPAQVIKTPALNVQVGKIEYCKDNNVVV